MSKQFFIQPQMNGINGYPSISFSVIQTSEINVKSTVSKFVWQKLKKLLVNSINVVSMQVNKTK